MKNLYDKILKNISTALSEALSGNLSIASIDNDNKILIIDNKDFDKWSNKIYKMLYNSYKNIGGLATYEDFNEFLDKHPIIKVVLNKNNKLLACATYRKVQSSLKMVAIGCNQKYDGKIALQQIIIDDIQNIDLHYWVEASGAIEYYFKKYNGYPMPNILAHEILEMPENNIELSDKDNVHYKRKIGVNKKTYSKMIFGIKSQEIFEKAIIEVGDYDSFMNDVNNIKDDINESIKKIIYTPKQAIYIIENIYRLHEEDKFNELIPKWHKALTDSINTLKYAKNNHAYDEEIINTYLEYGNYLLTHMPLLKLHKLKF